jgi:hypothetical protein
MAFEGSKLWIGLISLLSVVALLAVLIPQNERRDYFLTKITICTVLFIVSLYSLLWFVKVLAWMQVREGFEDSIESQWTTTLQNPDLDSVCSIFTEVYENKLKTEKGSPPNEITEDEARERVDAELAKACTLGVFSCSLYQDVKTSTTLDTIYVDAKKLPDTFLAQAYQTLLVSKGILEKTIKDIEDSLSKVSIEGFDTLCSPEAAKTRRQKEDPANDPAKCVLAEEISPEIKQKDITQKLETLKKSLQTFQGSGTSFADLSIECGKLKGKLAELKAKAESGTLLS